MEQIPAELIRPMKNVISFTVNETPNQNEPVGICIVKRSSIAFWDLATRLQFIRVRSRLGAIQKTNDLYRKLVSQLWKQGELARQFALPIRSNIASSTSSVPLLSPFTKSPSILMSKSCPKFSFLSATNTSALPTIPHRVSASSSTRKGTHPAPQSLHGMDIQRRFASTMTS